MPESLRDEGTRDTRLIERAVRERWPVTEEMRAKIVQRQYRIAVNPRTKHREATSAAKTIISADAQNIAEKRVAEQHQHLHLHEGDQVVNLTGDQMQEEFERYLRAIEISEAEKRAG